MAARVAGEDMMKRLPILLVALVIAAGALLVTASGCEDRRDRRVVVVREPWDNVVYVDRYRYYDGYYGHRYYDSGYGRPHYYHGYYDHHYHHH